MNLNTRLLTLNIDSILHLAMDWCIQIYYMKTMTGQVKQAVQITKNGSTGGLFSPGVDCTARLKSSV